MQFYVYCWYDEDYQPYYVGKGCGNRAYKARGIPHPPKGNVVLKYFDLEEDAYEFEKTLIAFWGRKDIDENGRLLNVSLGGPGVCDAPVTDVQRKARATNCIKRSKEFYVTSPDGVERRITNLAKFCREHGLHRPNLLSVALGKRKHSKLWTCRYANE